MEHPKKDDVIYEPPLITFQHIHIFWRTTKRLSKYSEDLVHRTLSTFPPSVTNDIEVNGKTVNLRFICFLSKFKICESSKLGSASTACTLLATVSSKQYKRQQAMSRIQILLLLTLVIMMLVMVSLAKKDITRDTDGDGLK